MPLSWVSSSEVGSHPRKLSVSLRADDGVAFCDAGFFFSIVVVASVSVLGEAGSFGAVTDAGCCSTVGSVTLSLAGALCALSLQEAITSSPATRKKEVMWRCFIMVK